MYPSGKFEFSGSDYCNDPAIWTERSAKSTLFLFGEWIR